METATNKFFLALGMMLLMAMGCTTSKSLMKDGMEFQSAGMYEQAVEAYKQSISRKITNIESKKGLQEAGQRLLEVKLDEFSRARLLERNKEAVYSFMDAESFMESLKRYGVRLEIPDHYLRDYNAVEDIYLSDLYSTGAQALEDEQFEKAEKLFQEIARIHPGYGEVESKLGKSVLEPEYRKGDAQFAEGRYRDAYRTFERIVAQDPNYRDALSRMDLSLEKGRFVMALLPFDAHGHPQEVATRVQAYTMDGLSDLDNPFLKIVDRQNLDRIIAEQQFSVSGVIDEASAVEVGNLTGAEAILIGELIDYRESPGKLQVRSQNGYESYSVKEKDSEGNEKTVTRYRPVTYKEYRNTKEVFVSIHVKLLSLETSEVLISEIIDRELSDEVDYVRYDGNASRLFPQRNDRVWKSRSAVNSLRGRVDARTELSSTATMRNDLNKYVGQAIAGKIAQFLD